MFSLLSKIARPLTRNVAKKVGRVTARTVAKFFFQGAATAALTAGAVSMANATSRTGSRIAGVIPRQGDLTVSKPPAEGGPREPAVHVHQS